MENPWTGKKHTQSFETKSNAITFLDAQTSIAQKEKLLLKKGSNRSQPDTESQSRNL